MLDPTIREINNLEDLLYNTYQRIEQLEDLFMPYELKIKKLSEKSVKEYELKTLRELKEILDTYKESQIEVDLHEIKVFKKIKR